jgi:hypothetical protein
MRYLLEVPPDDPFALVAHPWEPFVRAVHIVSTPLFAIALGWIVGTHAMPKVHARARGGRPSGLVVLLSILPLAATDPLV